jgi:aminopeptidase N
MRALSVSILGALLLVSAGPNTLRAQSDLDHPLGHQKRFAAADAALRDGPPDPPTDYDAVHYGIHIDADFDAESIHGDVAITARSLVPELTHVVVDLSSGYSVTSVTRDSTSLFFFHANDRLTIRLEGPVGLGEDVTVRVRYWGFPNQINPGGLRGWRFDTDALGNPVASTKVEPWFARYWWPCKETPADKATVDISFTVPSDFIAASNGRLVDVTSNGNTKTYYWNSNYPSATYLVSAAIAKYATFSDEYVTADQDTVPLDYYVYPQDLANAQAHWPGWVPQMLAIQAGFFGEYPFAAEKYGMAAVMSMPMEHQTLTSVTPGWIGHEITIFHELAHQWWGDMVTCATWHDIWLNEGFATYSQAFYYGVTDPPDGYDEHMAWMEFNIDEGWGSVYRYDLDDPDEVFNADMVYLKGAWVLHMLRHLLGDEAFFAGFAAYRSAFEYGSATTEDFIAAMEGASGTSLRWFFDEWVYGVERPRYEYWWLTDTPEPGLVTIHIDQVQTDAPLFKMPIDIDVVTDLGTESFVVWDSLATQEFVLDVTGTPSELVFDPGNWVLEWHSELPTATPGTVLSGLGVPRITCSPLPFHDRLAIAFAIPGSWREAIDVGVYDLGGRRVRTLYEGTVPEGRSETSWNGLTSGGAPAAPGVYFVRLRSGDREVATRVVRVR